MIVRPITLIEGFENGEIDVIMYFGKVVGSMEEVDEVLEPDGPGSDAFEIALNQKYPVIRDSLKYSIGDLSTGTGSVAIASIERPVEVEGNRPAEVWRVSSFTKVRGLLQTNILVSSVMAANIVTSRGQDFKIGVSRGQGFWGGRFAKQANERMLEELSVVAKDVRAEIIGYSGN